jgi:hypothetical protein
MNNINKTDIMKGYQHFKQLKSLRDNGLLKRILV